MGTPIKGKKIMSSGPVGSGSILKNTITKEESMIAKQIPNKAVITDYAPVGISENEVNVCLFNILIC